MKRFFLCFVALWSAHQSSAANFSSSARGTTVADFLNIGVSARAMSLGGAYSAVADDASAVYWNPAAMTRVQKRSFTLMHSSYLTDESFYDYAAYVQNGETAGFFGIGAQYFSAGVIPQTDESGAEIGSFVPYDLALLWSYAREIGHLAALPFLEGTSLGLSVKLIDSRILTSASAGAFDLGLLSRPYFNNRLRVALTAMNLGGDGMQFDKVKQPLPEIVRIGGAFEITNRLLVCLDGDFPKSDDPYAAAGVEYQFNTSGYWKFTGRLGFNSRTLGSIDGFTGAAAGFGVALEGWSTDYSFVPMGGLGQVHRLSLTYNF